MSRASPGCSKNETTFVLCEPVRGTSTNRANRATYIDVLQQPVDQEAQRAPGAARCDCRQVPESQQLFKPTHRFCARLRRSSAGDDASFPRTIVLVARHVQHARCLRRCSAKPTKRSLPWCVARQRNRCASGVGRTTPGCQTGTQPWPLPGAQSSFRQQHSQSAEARARWRIFSAAP